MSPVPYVITSATSDRREARTRVAVTLVVAVVILAALAWGCAPPVPREEPHAVCRWPAPDCCNEAPRLPVVKLADLRAERWGR